MNDITALTDINFPYVFLSVFIILIGLKAIISLFEWFINKFGIETKHTKEKRKEHELLINTAKELTDLKAAHEESVKQSIKHDQMIKEDLSNLTHTVNSIAQTLSDMQSKDNETKLKELKSSLVRYYNKYKNIGEWNKLECAAFWDLFYEYESRGGNDYVHSVIEPVMRELKEID